MRARWRRSTGIERHHRELAVGRLSDLPTSGEQFDLVWCAQSLFSLPEPVAALRQMKELLRPGGLVFVLENDTLHQVLLPWPAPLELALRAAELAAFSDQTRRPGKFYVARRLPAVFAEAGLKPLGFQTQPIDRQAPLDGDLEMFLQSYLERLAQRVSSYLDSSLACDFAALVDPSSDACLLRQPHFTMSWLNLLAWGRRPPQG